MVVKLTELAQFKALNTPAQFVICFGSGSSSIASTHDGSVLLGFLALLLFFGPISLGLYINHLFAAIEVDLPALCVDDRPLHPRMVNNLLNCRPFLWVERNHTLEQILELGGEDIFARVGSL